MSRIARISIVQNVQKYWFWRLAFNCLRVVSQFGALAAAGKSTWSIENRAPENCLKTGLLENATAGQVRKASFQHSRSTRVRGAESYSATYAWSSIMSLHLGFKHMSKWRKIGHIPVLILLQILFIILFAMFVVYDPNSAVHHSKSTENGKAQVATFPSTFYLYFLCVCKP